MARSAPGTRGVAFAYAGDRRCSEERRMLYAGLPMFPIPLYALQDIIRENSPADRLAASV